MLIKTLSQLFHQRKDLLRKGITFVRDSSIQEFISYNELYETSKNILSNIQAHGLSTGDELIFQIADNKIFIQTFWACILGGIVPVPLSIGQNDDHRLKLFNIWRSLKSPFLISSADDAKKIIEFGKSNDLSDVSDVLAKRMLLTDQIISSSSTACYIYEPQPSEIAFIQFSSGSTGSPKGVILTHENLLSNVSAIADSGEYVLEDSTLSWMPLTHDMGLIGFHINPLFVGMNQAIIPTNSFIRNPKIWIEKAHELRSTILCSPNFGYSYLLKNLNDEITYEWDLAHVRLVYNGAEPISEKICIEFSQRMKAYGLRPSSICPVYGLAEGSLAVTMSNIHEEMKMIQVDRDFLSPGQNVVFNPNHENSITLLDLGKSIPNCSFRITDDADNPKEEGIVGYIQISGSSVTQGYYNNSKITSEVFTPDGWLRTGDLGFQYNNSLFVTGRAKDILFVNGKNVYPHDIENVALKINGIELNKIAVCGSFNHELQTEQVVVFVFHRSNLNSFVQKHSELTKLLSLEFSIQPDAIIPVKDIPRTTSGKLQRFKLFSNYLNGEYNEVLSGLKSIFIAKSENEYQEVELTSTEKQVMRVWQDLFKDRKIKYTDDFFEIGGNSLKVAQLGVLLSKKFLVDIPFNLLYNNNSIKEISAQIDILQSNRQAPLALVNDQDFYRLSRAQKSIYYSWALAKESISYNIPLAFTILGSLNTEKLQQAIRKVAQRHDAFKISFIEGANPKFRLRTDLSFELQILECEEPETVSLLKSLVQPFDLAEDILFRVKLIQVSSAKNILFLDFHHSIADGQSVHIFLKEVLMAYSDISLEDISVNYRDYAETIEESVNHQEAHLFWEKYLSGKLPFLELPNDYPRPTLFLTEGEKIEFELTSELTAELRLLAGKTHCSMHVLLFSLYQLLLFKYTGQNEIISGIPVAGRLFSSLEPLIGMFVNNIPVRTTLENDCSFLDFLSAQKNNIKNVLKHQHYPFEELSKLPGTKRDMSRNLIFDNMFNYQNIAVPTIAQSNLSISRFFFNPGFSKYDFSVEIFDDNADRIVYAVEYSTSLFKKDTALNIAKHFELLIGKVVDDPQKPIGHISVLSDYEKEEFVTNFNQTDRVVSTHNNIYHLFANQAKLTPDKIALEFGNQELTYSQLEKKVCDFQDSLKLLNLQGQIVSVLLERSFPLLIALLAILKSGKAFIPIDPELPTERIKHIVNSSQSNLLITDKELVEIGKLDVVGIESNVLDIKTGVLIKTISNTAAKAFGKNTLAYVIYTSGTTGRPKGVMVGHHSLINYVEWASKSYLKGELASFPLFTSISFDLTLTSIFVPLVSGGTIVIYPNDEPHIVLEQVIRDNKVDVVKLTPSHLRIVKNIPYLIALSESRLKRFIVGGEQLDYHLAKEIHDKFEARVELYNEYGPTEATIGCMIHRFDPEEISNNVPIGLPAANTKLYLLDDAYNPVPLGVKGKLFISGQCLSLGYLHDENLTDNKFIKNPYDSDERMYDTGDIAIRLSSGNLEYLGRSDQQIKLNGHRIEPSEIEVAISSHYAVSDVVVKLEEKGLKRLIAYYVITSENIDNIDDNVFKNYLADRLPNYMIPVRYIAVENIPLTPNGKVDFEALPNSQLETERHVVRAKNYIEEKFLQVWENVLDTKNLSVEDNFFDLGGDSIKAVQITSKLAEQGIVIKVKDILTFHTIAQISLYAVQSQNANAKIYEQGMLSGEFEFSPIARWFFDQKLNNQNFYNQSILLKLHRKVDIGLLTQTFKIIIKHHDALRVKFNQNRNNFFYSDWIEEEFSIETILGGLNEDPFKQLKAGLNINSGPMFKVANIKNEEGESLFITVHHLIIDAFTWRVFLEDIFSVYTAIEKGRNVSLPSKTASLVDWNKTLNEYSWSEKFRSQQNYWEKIGHTSFKIPQDHENEFWEIKHSRKVRKVFSAEKTSFLLKGANKTYKTDAQELLLSALSLSIHEWCGNDLLVLELENYGRHLSDTDLSRTFGWFTTIYPVCLKVVAGAESIGQHIMNTKEVIRNVPDNGIGYGVYKQVINSLSYMAPAEIRFNYLGQFNSELNNELFSHSQQEIGVESDPENNMNAKLEYNLLISNGELVMELIFNETAHSSSTANKLLDGFANKLDFVLNHISAENNIYFTPSDFKAADLSNEELDALFQ